MLKIWTIYVVTIHLKHVTPVNKTNFKYKWNVEQVTRQQRVAPVHARGLHVRAIPDTDPATGVEQVAEYWGTRDGTE